MSGADDLHADDLIDDLIRAVMDHTHGREGVLDRKGAEKDLREYVADPERRLSIFDAMGLDVAEVRMPEWFNPGHTTDFQAIHVGRENQRYGFDALVVYPRGEATE